MSARTILRSALAALAALGVVAPQALAAVTRTHVSNPQGSPTWVTYNVAGGGSLPVAGQSNGGPAPLDLRCDASGSTLLKANVIPNANGDWSITLVSAQLNLIAGHACVLRAVPHGLHPLSRTAFSGPTIAVNVLRTSVIGGGPNNGALYDFGVGAPQLQGRATYSSVGGCGLGAATVADPNTLAETSAIFSCAGRIAGNASGRPGLKVDGIGAYAPAAALNLFGAPNSSVNVPGFQSPTYTVSIDPVTGNVLVRELSQFLECAPQPAAFPASAATCSSFTQAPVRLDRSWQQDHAGLVSLVTDSWYSTDGKPHRIDVFYESSAGGTAPAYWFPWLGSTSQIFSAGASVTLPAGSGPGSFYVKRATTVSDTDRRQPHGAITFKSTPDFIRFKDATTVQLDYGRAVPAQGALRLAFVYSRSYTLPDVESFAKAAEAALTNPPCIVPRVLGTTLAVAKARLHAGHCLLGRITRQFATDVRAGRVKAQRPKAGSVLRYNAPIAITLSRGKR